MIVCIKRSFLYLKYFRLEKEEGIKFKYREEDLGKSNNIMDKWILSFVQSLVLFLKQEMNGTCVRFLVMDLFGH